jgi:hypothetical protein
LAHPVEGRATISRRKEAITMWWMDDLVVPAVLLVGVCCFVLLVRFRAGMITRRTDRTAEGMYANYADSPHKQRKLARKHGG